ncbi:hypothetical protein [Algibacter sp. PT7-4]|uniref:hypothetical protein n=1 Tax=Algibacter ulvanivorans TaxID=3400999 RepID=UPI003AAADC94
MKFAFSIKINKPLLEVVKHFKDPDALKQSQKDFLRLEHLSGTKGHAGAKSKLVYKNFDLIETIILNNLPKEFYAKYEHKKITNTMNTKFSVFNSNQTIMQTTIEYTEFKGVLLKILANFFPNMFKKQIDKWLIKFKLYCENH